MFVINGCNTDNCQLLIVLEIKKSLESREHASISKLVVCIESFRMMGMYTSAGELVLIGP